MEPGATVQLFAPVLAGIFSLATLLILLKSRGLPLDRPNQRSSHAQPTPRGGGVGIVLGGTAAGVWLGGLGGFADTVLWGGITMSLAIAAIGLWDDVRSVPPALRLCAQLAVCAGALAVLPSLPPLDLPFGAVVSGALLWAALLLAGVWWINLFNFMDGIDGIAGAQAVFMLAAAAGLAAWMNPALVSHTVWLWMLGVAVATLGFLVLNWPPAKIFMGDVGSSYLALMIFFVALLTVQAGWLPYQAWLILGAVFVTDATVTLLTRMARRERWAQAHRSHAYQRLAQRWRSHRAVTLGVIAINLLWLLPLAWACATWPEANGGSSWGWAALAYAPLVAGVLAAGGGRAEHA